MIINGPNLNLLGTREREIYGHKTLAQINQEIAQMPVLQGIDVEFFQSNHEGVLIDKIQEARGKVKVIIINPGALTHYSIAIHDALKAVAIPVIEVHLSNIYAREDFRAASLIAPIAAGSISGFGPSGYRLAVLAACELMENAQSPSDLRA